MTEEQKPVEWGNYRGCYLGLSEAPKTGIKQNGDPWVKNKLNFTHVGVDGQQKNVTFGTFLDVSGLAMGSYYHIVFKTDEFNLKDGTPAKSKTATTINPSKKEDQQGFEPKPVQQAVAQATATQVTTQQQVANNQIPSMKPAIDYKGFAEAYRNNEKKPISEKTVADFVGNYVFKYDKELFTLLKGLYDEYVAPNDEPKQ